MLLALAAALCLTLSTPPQAPVRSKVVTAPASELVVLWSAGREALLVDARDAGLAQALGMLDARLAELGRDLDDPRFPGDALRLVHALLAGPACLRVERVAGRPGELPLWLQLACRARDATAAQRNVEELGLLAARAGMPVERIGASEPTLAVATPLGPLVLTAQGDALVLALGEPRKEAFAPPADVPKGVAPALHARWNGRGVGELLEPFVRSGGAEAQRLWSALEVLGVVGTGAPERTWTLGLASDRALARSVVSGWAAAGDGALGVPPLDAADFARVPPDATFARLLQLRPRMLLALAESLGSGAELDPTLRAMLGVDLGELLDLFGPTAGVFTALSTGGGGVASGVAFVETTDAAGLEAVLARVATLIEAAGAGPARGRVALRTSERAGTRVRTLVFPGLPIPLELSLAVQGDALWLALRPDALVAALESVASGRSVLEHPRLAPLAAERPADAVAFAFFDAPPYLERGYGNACALGAALANALRSPYEPAREPGSILPPFAALRAGARPSVSWSFLAGADLVSTTSFDRSFVASATVALGTPFTSLYGSTMGLAMVSSIAIPKLMSARLSANESAAIATLRALASAQAQFHVTAAIDSDGDGTGEYGFLGELSGARALRGQRVRLQPPVLSSSFAALRDDGNGDGVVERSGYWFQVWLPGRSGAASERVRAGGAVPVQAEAAEIAWCAYAWPVEPGSTGQRAFFVNQEGDVLVFDNPGGVFGGLQATGGRQPAFDSALARPDLLSGVARGRRADGVHWRPLE
ncbi:MAG TPA: hypothetical protein VF530_15500 [Planctomycetota bacterium]